MASSSTSAATASVSVNIATIAGGAASNVIVNISGAAGVTAGTVSSSAAQSAASVRTPTKNAVEEDTGTPKKRRLSVKQTPPAAFLIETPEKTTPDALAEPVPKRYKDFHNAYRRWIQREEKSATSKNQLKLVKTRGNLRALQVQDRYEAVKLWAAQDVRARQELRTWALETFCSRAAEQDQPKEAKTSTKWLCQSSALLTWNGSWGLFTLEDVVGERRWLDLKELCSLLAKHERVQRLVQHAEDFIADKMTSYYVQDAAFSFEVCPSTYEDARQAALAASGADAAEESSKAAEPFVCTALPIADAAEPVARTSSSETSLVVAKQQPSDCPVRLHMHAFFRSGSKIQIRKADHMKFLDSIPQKSALAFGSGGGRGRSSNMGLYYLQCPKVGMVHWGGSTKPFTGYLVNGEWVLSWLQQHKIEYPEARREIIKSTKNLPRLLSSLDRFKREYDGLLLEAQISRTMQELEKSKRPFREVPAVRSWLESFAELRMRYKFLVLEGGSCLGKTRYALSLGANIFECDCAGCEDPPMADFSNLHHDGALFDEASAKLVLKQKKLFQAGSSWVTLGKSATNCHSFEVWPHRKKFIVSSNRWTSEVSKLPEPDKAWLADNCVHVLVDAPLWVQ